MQNDQGLTPYPWQKAIDFWCLLVYLNSVRNYVDSTQIWVSLKGNMLVHKVGHQDRIQTQWFMISTVGCAIDLVYVFL